MANDPNVQSTGTDTAEQQEQTFTQADVDRLVKARLERERKKYPSDEEMAAYRKWSDEQQSEQEKQEKREKAYLKAQSDLAAAQGELEQLKREKYVATKGLSGEEADFLVYRAAKLVDEKTTFEQAVDKLTENRTAKVKIDWAAQAGNGSKEGVANSVMNDLIRGALK